MRFPLRQAPCRQHPARRTSLHCQIVGIRGTRGMLKPGITLYYVRHGETDWNLAQRYQGRRDIPINATGRAQAEQHGLKLAAVLAGRAAALDYVASPPKRASEPLEILRPELGLRRAGHPPAARHLEMG